MLEALKETSSSTMAITSVNGVVRDKYKRRKVSANRLFPNNCGRCAAAGKTVNIKRVEQAMAVSEQNGKSLEKVELVGVSVQTKEDIEMPSKTMEPVKGSDENFVTASVPMEVDNGAETAQEAMKGSDEQRGMDLVTASVAMEVVNEAEISVHLGSVRKEFPPRRRVSATRDFPEGWSKAPRLTNGSLKDAIEDTENSLSKKLENEIVDSGKNADEQSVKTNVSVDSDNSVCAENQLDGSAIVDSSGEKVIVQDPMSAQKCPWRDAKGDVQSTPTQGTTSHQVRDQETVPNTRNNVEHNSDQIMSLDDEEDSQEHDATSENISSVPRPARSTLTVIPFGRPASNNADAVTRSKVRETLRLFQAMFRKSLQEEESKLKVPGTMPKRIDLATASEMKKQNKWVNTGGGKILGSVPGVEVGDEFHYRVELSIIGLHGPFQGGIDYVKKGGKKIVATSVVSSGGYDDIDNFDILLYSGQGGNPVGDSKKAEDQKLERGNLALKNSIDEKTPVRVIRGFKETKGSDSADTRGKTVVTYTYDGLYLVDRYWQEKGRHGNTVYKFELRRIPGQPELALREVQKSRNSKVREGLCVDDISQGKEKMRICAVNIINGDKPPEFKYIAKMKYTSSYDLVPLEGGCGCKDGCSDSEKCLCAVKNGGEIPFNHNGALVEQKTIVYECGPHCKCPPSCHNRVSQHGIKFQLEIFKTKTRGWGVRSLNSIASGSFICEYTGELLSEKEADQRTGNDEYLFDLGRSKSSTPCENEEEEEEEQGFTIDAFQYGSVSRFINHSCSPNLVAQNVLYDHDDKRMPHIMLFAGENIPPLQELTYDYNYVEGTVKDSAGEIKIKECYCGSTECTGRMY